MSQIVYAPSDALSLPADVERAIHIAGIKEPLANHLRTECAGILESLKILEQEMHGPDKEHASKMNFLLVIRIAILQKMVSSLLGSESTRRFRRGELTNSRSLNAVSPLLGESSYQCYLEFGNTESAPNPKHDEGSATIMKTMKHLDRKPPPPRTKRFFFDFLETKAVRHIPAGTAHKPHRMEPYKVRTLSPKVVLKAFRKDLASGRFKDLVDIGKFAAYVNGILRFTGDESRHLFMYARGEYPDEPISIQPICEPTVIRLTSPLNRSNA